MASTACAPPAFKSIAELVGARAHTTLIGEAPGPHGTSVRPRDTGLEASAGRVTKSFSQPGHKFGRRCRRAPMGSWDASAPALDHRPCRWPQLLLSARRN